MASESRDSQSPKSERWVPCKPLSVTRQSKAKISSMGSNYALESIAVSRSRTRPEAKVDDSRRMELPRMGHASEEAPREAQMVKPVKPVKPVSANKPRLVAADLDPGAQSPAPTVASPDVTLSAWDWHDHVASNPYTAPKFSCLSCRHTVCQGGGAGLARAMKHLSVSQCRGAEAQCKTFGFS